MKLALTFTGRRNRIYELPTVVGLCHDFKTSVPGRCSGRDPRITSTAGVVTVPFGKYQLSNVPVPCGTNPLIAQAAQPKQLRELFRTQCCPTCK